MGVITSIGATIEAFTAALREGKNGIKPIASFDASKHSVRIAGEIADFDPCAYLPRKEARRHDRYSQFGLVAAQMAIRSAGIEKDKLDNPKRVGVLLASGIGGIHTFEAEYDTLQKGGPSRVSPFLVPMMICNIASGCVAIDHGFKGPNFCIVSACASGLHAMGEAYHQILLDQADIVVCGGAEAAITPLTVAGFASMKALSTRNDEPHRASRPFDRDRDGFVMGEGAGVFVIETEESMKRRGVRPLAEVRGYGASADANHITAPDPDGEGAFEAMTRALSRNQTPVARVNYVNAHGTSTALNDKIETHALKRVLGSDCRSRVLVNSTKSMIGHLLGAAGSVGAVATVAQMAAGFVHPTVNLENPDEACDLDYVAGHAREHRIDHALINSFGFGGQNASLLLARAD